MTGTGTTRRRILNWFFGTSLGAVVSAVVYPVARFMTPPRLPEAQVFEVEAGLTDDPEFIENRFKIVRFGVEPVIVIRISADEYRAFTATCTHLDCLVDYREDKQLIWCWCHNGVYDLTGRNIDGPPPRPLSRFAVNLVPHGASGQRQIVISKT